MLSSSNSRHTMPEDLPSPSKQIALKECNDDDEHYIVPERRAIEDAYLNPGDLSDDDSEAYMALSRSSVGSYAVPERPEAADYMVIPKGEKRLHKKLQSAGQASIWSEGYMNTNEAPLPDDKYGDSLLRDGSRKPSLWRDSDTSSEVNAQSNVQDEQDTSSNVSPLSSSLQAPSLPSPIKRSNSILSRLLRKSSRRSTKSKEKPAEPIRLRRRSQSFHGLPDLLENVPEAGPAELERSQSVDNLNSIEQTPARHMTMDHQELLKLRSNTRRPRHRQEPIIRLTGFATGESNPVIGGNHVLPDEEDDGQNVEMREPNLRPASVPTRLLNTRLSAVEHQAYLKHRVIVTPFLQNVYNRMHFAHLSGEQNPGEQASGDPEESLQLAVADGLEVPSEPPRPASTIFEAATPENRRKASQPFATLSRKSLVELQALAKEEKPKGRQRSNSIFRRRNKKQHGGKGMPRRRFSVFGRKASNGSSTSRSSSTVNSPRSSLGKINIKPRRVDSKPKSKLSTSVKILNKSEAQERNESIDSEL
eukprot:TRINITY_DN6672_c0_g1_i1.p1 TRINITY_DN6672_c0_g1~~TRINITY_DN6672_c0_g1_i1.p1  ORF type:complete len:533 (+),score=79.74 TRINITY_DN6672_c0_g1_i1:279-1877(+)